MAAGATRLLAQAARLAGFDPLDGWPDTLPVDGLAALLADGDRKRARDWLGAVLVSIERGELRASARDVPLPSPRRIGSVLHRAVAPMPHRTGRAWYVDRESAREWLAVDRPAAMVVAWLAGVERQALAKDPVPWQEAIVQSWPSIIEAFGKPKPRAIDVMRWLQKHGPPDVFDTQVPLSNDVLRLAGGGHVKRHTVESRLSELRTAGRIV